RSGGMLPQTPKAEGYTHLILASYRKNCACLRQGYSLLLGYAYDYSLTSRRPDAQAEPPSFARSASHLLLGPDSTRASHRRQRTPRPRRIVPNTPTAVVTPWPTNCCKAFIPVAALICQTPEMRPPRTGAARRTNRAGTRTASRGCPPRDS